MMNGALPRTIFRHLMKSARIFDRHPVLKALLSRYSHSPDLGNILSSFLCGQNFYLPTPLMPRSMREFTRQTYSYPPFPEATLDTALAGLRYLNAVLRLAEQHGLYSGEASQQYSAERHETTENHLDSELPKDGPNSETFPGVQILSTAPEQGALLIAHPLQQGNFKRAVVLVTASHPWRGSTGLCINISPEAEPVLVKDYREHGSQVNGTRAQFRAVLERLYTSHSEALDTKDDEAPVLTVMVVEVDDTDGHEEVRGLNIGKVKLGDPEQRSSQTAGTGDAPKAEHSGCSQSGVNGLSNDEKYFKYFSCNKVFYGGPVPTGSLNTLHARADLGGVPVMGVGLHVGVSMERLQEQMAKGTVSADELQFFDGESIWAPLQLEEELAGGHWICMKMNEEDLVRLQQDQQRTRPAGSGQRHLWNRLLQSLGREYCDLSTIPESLAEEVAELNLN